MLTLQNSGILFLEMLEKLQIFWNEDLHRMQFISGEGPVLENINVDDASWLLLLFLVYKGRCCAEPKLKSFDITLSMWNSELLPRYIVSTVT